MNDSDAQRLLAAGPGTPQPGMLLAGKYRIQRVIGVGGMGVVFAAEHEELGERVAIKCLLSHLVHDAVFVARFQREARAAVKIRSEHIARVLDVSKTAEGVPFIVMEYLEGQDLGALLETTPRLPVAVAIGYVLQACEALAEAHSLGIVHRDLKPENLFLTHHADGTEYVKVMDFGISKMANAGPDNLSLTRTGGGVMGSPLYMAPEQMRSAKDADPRTDIWALGAMLFEFIAGDPPFMAASIQEIVAMIVQDPTPSLVERAAANGVTVPHELEAAIERALQKHAHARYADVGEFALAVAPFGDEEARASALRIARVLERRARSIATGSSSSISIPSAPVLPSARREGVGTQSAATWTDIRPPPRSRSRVVLLGALGLFGVALLGTVAAISMRPPQQLPSATLPSSTPTSAAVSAIEPPAAVLPPLADVPPPADSASLDVAAAASASTAAIAPGKGSNAGIKPDKHVKKPPSSEPSPPPPPLIVPAPVASSPKKPKSGLADGRHD